MNGSLTTLSLHVIGDLGLSNVFSFLNIVKQFLILTCLVPDGIQLGELKSEQTLNTSNFHQSIISMTYYIYKIYG